VIQKLALIGGVLAVMVATLAYPIGAIVAADTTLVWIIDPFDAGTIEISRFTFEADHPNWDAAKADASDPATAQTVAKIYGNPSSEPLPVLWVPADNIIHPKELPGLALLPQDYDTTGKYWQSDTVWLICRYLTIAAAVAGGALLGLWGLLRLWHRRVAAAA
jgi:hypothetical protein